MIERITNKEYRRLKDLHKNGFTNELLFDLPDGTHYRCTTKAGAGLKEIMRFRLQKKKEMDQNQQLDLILNNDPA